MAWVTDPAVVAGDTRVVAFIAFSAPFYGPEGRRIVPVAVAAVVRVVGRMKFPAIRPGRSTVLPRSVPAGLPLVVSGECFGSRPTAAI